MNKSNILVAGSPCSGKTTLINQLHQKITSLPVEVDISIYECINANSIRQQPIFPPSQLCPYIIHYDNMRPYKRGQIFDPNLDPFLAYLHNSCQSKNWIIITLLTSMENLKSRLNERLNRLNNDAALSKFRLAKLQKIKTLYNNRELYIDQMTLWLEYVKTLKHSQHFYYVGNTQQKDHPRFFTVDSIEQQISLLNEWL